MSRRWMIGCWSLLSALAFQSTPSAACGWFGCDGYGYYAGPLGYSRVADYGYYAAPAYYVPAPVVYVPPPVTYVPLPVYQYAPPINYAYYDAPAARPYYDYGGYGVRRAVVSTRYYGPRRTVVRTRYYGARRAYVRPVHYAGPVRRAARRW